MEKKISGFSKFSKSKKIRWIVENFFKEPDQVMQELESFWHSDEDQQKVLDGFSENTISNFILPFGVAPNFLINDKVYCVPMVIEESSVVAAASSAAKFWLNRGGFRAEIINTKKVGQLHFTWKGDADKLNNHFEAIETHLVNHVKDLTSNMEKRGGGILDMELLNMSVHEPHYYQLRVNFETCDSMGANFINSILESFGGALKQYMLTNETFTGIEKDVNIIMAILSNYTPECVVRTTVQCPVGKLGDFANGIDAASFAEKFRIAVRIAEVDPYRATTHNKGIFNGIDAVVIATANDFRAIESCGHTYASRSGQYRSLSSCTVENGQFKFWMDIPLALGTVGGLTSLHPIAKRSLELLGNPGAQELMMVIASAGLAQNFAAIKSLITTGIQKGHMKMHLLNILRHLSATSEEEALAIDFFDNRVVSFTAVRNFLHVQRNNNVASTNGVASKGVAAKSSPKK